MSKSEIELFLPLRACALGIVIALFGCSSGSGGVSSDSGPTDTGTVSDGASTLTGTCATLRVCCAGISNASEQLGCQFAANGSGNVQGVCSDALVKYGPMCTAGSDAGADTAGSDVGTTDVGISDIGGGCGPVGATPAPIPTACQPTAGACIYHEHDTPTRGAEIVCFEFSGKWSLIPSSAQTECTSSGPTGMHEWVAGKHCSEVVTGIQGGCESQIPGSGMCTTSWYGPGCATAMGMICNTETSTGGLWVAPP
jgi:hypothetical protein